MGVFLIGGLVGGLVVWDLTDTKLAQFMTKTNDPDGVIVARVTQKYASDYHLTPEELSRIEPLIKEMAQHISHIRREFGADIISTLDEYHGKIAQQLNPEHREAYVQATLERKKQIGGMLLTDPSPSDPGKN